MKSFLLEVFMSNVGAMTRAMRAVETRGPRVLRLARLEAGRIVEERKLSAGERIGGAKLVRSGDAWSMRLGPGVRARIADGGRPIDVEGPAVVALGREARGKVVEGDAVHLFQIVAEAPRFTAQLPLSVLGRTNVDWQFAILAACSLLAHFGLASVANADWLDPTIDDAAETASLIAQTEKRPEVPLEEPTNDVSPGEPTKTTTPTKVATGPTKQHGPSTPSRHPSTGDTLNALGDTLAALDLATVGSFDKHAPAKSKLLEQGSPADAALDEVAKKTSGVDPDGPGIKAAPGTAGPIAGDGKSWTIGDTKSTPPKTVVALPSDEPKVLPKEPSILPPSGNAPTDVSLVIAKNRWRLKACYRRELGTNPDAQGTAKVRVDVDSDGTVTNAAILSSDFSPTMNACLVSSYRAMHFSGDGSKTRFDVPGIFSPAGK